jgi:hypothetical protein
MQAPTILLYTKPTDNEGIPSFLTFSPNTRYTCVPFTITKLASPTSTARPKIAGPAAQATTHHFTEWRRCKASYVPHTSRHVAAVLLEPSAPIHLRAPLALVCFVIVFWYETFISLQPRSSAGIVRSENRDSRPWLIGRHGISAGPIGDSLKHCATDCLAFSHSKLQPRSLVTPEEATNSCPEEAPRRSL